MGNDNYADAISNMGNVLGQFSKSMSKLVEGIDIMASSEALKKFVELIQSIPDDVKETKFFQNVQQLQKKDLHYEDVAWLVGDFGVNYTEEDWQREVEKVYVLAVMYIVFANTDSYTQEIDKRIPFRNHILHNGIVMYSEEEVEIAYRLLVGLIGILVKVKKRICE